MDATAENTVIFLLRSIDATLKELLALSKSKRAATPAPVGAWPPVATDADLDGPHGDPIVKFLPRDWTGDEYRQQPFSATTPEFLDALAKAYDYFYQKKLAENDPKAKWEALSAARARGWAQRLRNGLTRPAMMTESEVNW